MRDKRCSAVKIETACKEHFRSDIIGTEKSKLTNRDHPYHSAQHKVLCQAYSIYDQKSSNVRNCEIVLNCINNSHIDRIHVKNENIVIRDKA
jgi:hypothetical protein